MYQARRRFLAGADVMNDTVCMTGGYLLKLARQAAENYIKYGQPAGVPSPLPNELLQQRACYVSIMENPGRNLQAVYGQPLPQFNCLAQEVIHNTVEAIKIRRTGQFRPIDLSYMIYSVAVLGPLERITSAVHLNPESYGLYVRSDRNKSAIILPQRTGIESPADQIATALRESGINAEQEAVSMYRFYVSHYDQ